MALWYSVHSLSAEGAGAILAPQRLGVLRVPLWPHIGRQTRTPGGVLTVRL